VVLSFMTTDAPAGRARFALEALWQQADEALKTADKARTTALIGMIYDYIDRDAGETYWASSSEWKK
jgi:hypothetical protein